MKGLVTASDIVMVDGMILQTLHCFTHHLAALLVDYSVKISLIHLA